MTAYGVDLDELAAFVAQLDQSQQLILARMNELDERMAELHLTWAGAAASAQTVAHRQWSTGAQEMHDGLVTMHRAATVAHDNYLSAAESNHDMFRQTR